MHALGALILLFAAQDLKEGAVLDLAGKKATVRKVDVLPVVQSEYTKRFIFDSFDNPKLKELKEKYKLDEVVAPGKDEFDRQVLLLDWTHTRFKKFGKPSANPRGALEILKNVEEGHTFFCAQYAQTFCSAAASLGWWTGRWRCAATRTIPEPGPPSIRRRRSGPTSIASGSWSIPPPTCMSRRTACRSAPSRSGPSGSPRGKDLVFSIGKERKKHRKADLPIFLGRFAGFGDLTVPANEMEKYGFTAYIPNTNLMDAGPDYGKMFIVKDAVCEAKWHERTTRRTRGRSLLSDRPGAVSLKAEGRRIRSVSGP
jgi:hypothetical protein